MPKPEQPAEAGQPDHARRSPEQLRTEKQYLDQRVSELRDGLRKYEQKPREPVSSSSIELRQYILNALRDSGNERLASTYDAYWHNVNQWDAEIRWFMAGGEAPRQTLLDAYRDAIETLDRVSADVAAWLDTHAKRGAHEP